MNDLTPWSASPDDVATWGTLSLAARLAIGRLAMMRAATTLAAGAEAMADEMGRGTLPDLGGMDALRRYAAIIREATSDPMPCAGTA